VRAWFTPAPSSLLAAIAAGQPAREIAASGSAAWLLRPSIADRVHEVGEHRRAIRVTIAAMNTAAKKKNSLASGFFATMLVLVSTLFINSAAIASSVVQNRFDAIASSAGPSLSTIAPSIEPTTLTTPSTHGVEGPKTRAEIFLGVSLKSIERSEPNPVNSSRIYDALEAVALECLVAPKGGAHGQTKLPWGDGFESHHMPPKSVNGLHPDVGPAIKMERV
jgi:hypothetical protein